jgi:alkanesulfonate monooxygenase SsuD/methylene tetrahydromethanopterin reductase-like flavin-dependent oxidoreductase (luciferase family)
MFTMRYTMRAPLGCSAAERADLYSATVDMCAWAEDKGAVAAVICQHHASDDGYIPSPLPLAAAIAARTSTLAINIAALLLLYYEPVKLAEDLAVVDLISRGRVSAVVGLGYRDVELAMFGVDRKTRGRLAEERIGQLRRLWAGETVDVDGRLAAVTPLPFTPGGPLLIGGGGSVPAMKRAARLGMMVISENGDPALGDAYYAEAERCGIAPVGVMLPTPDESQTVFVTDDPDKGWAELGPYLLQDALSYASWNTGRDGVLSLSQAVTVEELRAENGSYQIVTPARAAELTAQNRVLGLQPLCGGIPPQLAWSYLEAAAAVG